MCAPLATPSARRSSRFAVDGAAAGSLGAVIATSAFLLGSSAVDKEGADEREHQLARLIGTSIEREYEPLVGVAPHRTRLDHLADERDGVPGIDRLRPLEVAKSRRRSGAADRFTARPHRLLLAQAVLHDQPDASGAAVPAGGDETAEMRLRPPLHRDGTAAGRNAGRTT